MHLAEQSRPLRLPEDGEGCLYPSLQQACFRFTVFRSNVDPEQSVTVNKAIDDATEEATSIARYDNFIIWFWRGVLIIFAAVVVISLIRKYS